MRTYSTQDLQSSSRTLKQLASMALRLKSAPRRESKNTNNPLNTKTFKIKFRKMWIIFP